MAREIVARYWQPTSAETGELVCTLCPHHCRMLPGETGRCGARGNAAGRLALLTWGLSSGFCIDPVEKKPLYHFLPGSPTLSFGGFGCNLACACCQNWQISRAPAPAVGDAARHEAADTIHAAQRRAAIVGVAVALAIEAERAATAPLLQPAQGAISPWQATIRGNALSRRAGAFQRTPPPSR